MSKEIAEAQKSFLPTGDEAWLDLHHEETLDPSRRIVDAHHHLWAPPRSQYLLDEFARDLNCGHKIVATVFADCTERYRTDGPEEYRSVGETEFAVEVAETAATSSEIGTDVHAGIISRVDLLMGRAARDVLEAHIAAGKGRFKGIRFASAWDPDPSIRSTARTPPEGLLYDARVRDGAATMAELGLVLDTWLYFHQIKDVIALADAVPDLSIVLDHVGGILGSGPYKGRRDDVFASWKTDLGELAKRPNVSAKIGGLGMKLPGFGFEDRPMPPSSQDLADAWRPYVETTIATFGPERAMFESNFPVDRLSCSYHVLWNGFKRLAAHYSESEQDHLFSGTAARVYSLDLQESRR